MRFAHGYRYSCAKLKLKIALSKGLSFPLSLKSCKRHADSASESIFYIDESRYKMFSLNAFFPLYPNRTWVINLAKIRQKWTFFHALALTSLSSLLLYYYYLFIFFFFVFWMIKSQYAIRAIDSGAAFWQERRKCLHLQGLPCVLRSSWRSSALEFVDCKAVWTDVPIGARSESRTACTGLGGT